MFPMRVPINYGVLFARTARYKLEIDCYVYTFLVSLHIQTHHDSSLPWVNQFFLLLSGKIFTFGTPIGKVIVCCMYLYDIDLPVDTKLCLMALNGARSFE